MNSAENDIGFAIAIAWPETYCKQAGCWYDFYCDLLGFSEHHFYKVGHAAIVLVHPSNGKCLYFDFGRYQSPMHQGRVRSEETDHSLVIHTRAHFSEDRKRMVNLKEILNELQLNEECHGEGFLRAGYCLVDFQRAKTEALKMQLNSPLPYGPFVIGGSNCSRFVRSVLLAGKPELQTALKLRLGIPFTPRPIDNVNAMKHQAYLPKIRENEAFIPSPIEDASLLNQTLPSPKRPYNLPENAQWLSGEGAGSWYAMENWEQEGFRISRYTSNGVLECRGVFEPEINSEFKPEIPYKFTHLSHCQIVTINQSDRNWKFFRKESKVNPHASQKRQPVHQF